MADLSSEDPRLARFCSAGFDASLKGIELLSAAGGRCEARITVTEPLQNWVGTLHGGAIATLVDDVGTLAIMSADPEGRAGVTTDLNVSYFSAAPRGSVVRVTGVALKAGRRLAFVEVDLHLEGESGERGKHVAQGRMTKCL